MVIDLDSQANATFAVGLLKFYDETYDTLRNSYIYQVLAYKDDYPISKVARKSEFINPPFHVIPSHIDLMEHELELLQRPQTLTRLLKKLNEIRSIYDVVLIDTPPSLNLYARIALIAADYLLIPSDLRPFANEGLRNVRRLVNEINKFREVMMREPVEIIGVVASRIGTTKKIIECALPKMIETVEKQYGFQVLDSIIFERSEIYEAVGRTQKVDDLMIPDPISIFDLNPESLAAKEFENLANEVMELLCIN